MKYPLLADGLMETLSAVGSNNARKFRRQIAEAVRFKIDAEAFAYITALGFQWSKGYENANRVNRTTDSMRLSAFAPHPLTWIEVDTKITNECLPDRLRKGGEALRVGWLIEQHQQISSALKLRRVSLNPAPDHPGDYRVMISEFVVAWTADDTTLPWPSVINMVGDRSASSLIVHDDYNRSQIGVVPDPITVGALDPKFLQDESLRDEMLHRRGELIIAWIMLMVLNDMPTERTFVPSTRGHVGNRKFRSFLSHNVITLKIPQSLNIRQELSKLIGRARRRRGLVRGHWMAFCKGRSCQSYSHHWKAEPVSEDGKNRQYCLTCGDRRTWREQHEAGDASLGYVTTSYSVERNKEAIT